MTFRRATATPLAVIVLTAFSLASASAQQSDYDDAIYCGVAMDQVGGYQRQADRAAAIAASIDPGNWEDDWADEDMWQYIDLSDDEIERIAANCAPRYE